jgi:hypothetical protein
MLTFSQHVSQRTHINKEVEGKKSGKKSDTSSAKQKGKAEIFLKRESAGQQQEHEEELAVTPAVKYSRMTIPPSFEGQPRRTRRAPSASSSSASSPAAPIESSGRTRRRAPTKSPAFQVATLRQTFATTLTLRTFITLIIFTYANNL